mgnify:CR=1 FL=1
MSEALLGVIIGGVIGVAGSLIPVLVSRRHGKRDALRERAASFLAATEAAWGSDQAFRADTFSLMSAEQNFKDQPEVVNMYNDQRNHSAENFRRSWTEARNLLAEIQIIDDELGVPAERLLTASQLLPPKGYNLLATAEEKAEHASARDAFIAAVRKHTQ